jgi:dihydroorotase
MYTYDLVIKGARIVDPGSGRSGMFDIGVNGEFIAAVEPEIPRAEGLKIIEAAGKIVTPGLIDLHAHVCDGITRHGINPDRAGVLQGVTTIVDGGSVGSHTFVGLRRHVLRNNRTRVVNFMNLCYSGQAWMPELRSLDDIDEDTLKTVMLANRDVIRGIKVRAVSPMIQNIGAQVVDIAKRFADLIDGHVMVHIGDHGNEAYADEVTPKIIAGLRAGDVVTHPYTAWPGSGVMQNGRPIPAIQEAAERGVVMDVGRGMMNFTIDNARRALEAGFAPTTISTDITLMTINGPVFGLSDTASIFLSLGMGLEDVVERVTATPARVLGLYDQIGSIEAGKRADLAVLEYRQAGAYEFHGFQGERMTGDKLLIPLLTIKDGTPIAAELPYGSAMHTALQESGKAPALI